MFRTKSIVLPVTALIALLATADRSAAQFGPGQQGPLWSRSQPGYSTVPLSTAPAAPATTTTQSFYNAPQNHRTVLIQMRVPTSARVFFMDSATTQTGADRVYVSPDLTPGRTYTYQIRVQWLEDGQEKQQTREVTVRPGDRINLDFTAAAPAAGGATP